MVILLDRVMVRKPPGAASTHIRRTCGQGLIDAPAEKKGRADFQNETA
jgi:hypothetical protein